MRRLALALLGALLLAGSAHAQTTDVYLLTWGGTIQQMLERDGWNKKFTEATGYNVILVPKATGPEIMATAIAQKDHPQVDVVMSDHLPWLAGLQQGLFAPLDPATAPNINSLYPAAKISDPTTGKLVGVVPYGDIFGFIYNKDLFAKKGWAPPTKWTDLERPEFKGQLLLAPGDSTYGLYNVVIQARAHGGDEHNIDPGFVAMKKIAPGVVDWSNTYAKMADFIQSGEASVAVYSTSSGVDMIRRGLPVAITVPTPSYMSPSTMGVMAHAPNPAGAVAFLNWWISPEVQKYRAEAYSNPIMNKTVELSPAAQVRVPHGAALEQLTQIDYLYVLAHRAEWSERFQKDITGTN
ncbi:MAG TPA: extracellular solute-binding protein [Acetobacteraceae bacterium]|jgi:putative spermidine/putrescine transport system substrate-binding protein|nr:extracellular solute-binding protein [Acetobacteraceae bacterium]